MFSLSDARTAATVALVSLVLYMSGLLTILTPLPLIYAWLVRGRACGIAAAVLSAAACAITYYLFVPAAWGSLAQVAAYLPIPGQGFEQFMPAEMIRQSGLGYFLFFVAVGISLAEGVRRKQTLSRWGANALLCGIAVLLISGLIAAVLWGQPVLDGIRSYVMYVISQVIEANQAAGSSGMQIELLVNKKEEVTAFVLRVLPAVAFVFALVTVALNLVIARRIIRKHHAFAHVQNVARFRMPDWLIWAVILSGSLFFANRYMLHNVWASAVSVNCLIGLCALYFFQGMAVVVYFLQTVKVPMIRTLTYVAMIIFLQTVSLMLVVVGVVDVWVDFRLRRWRAVHHHNNT